MKYKRKVTETHLQIGIIKASVKASPKASPVRIKKKKNRV